MSFYVNMEERKTENSRKCSTFYGFPSRINLTPDPSAQKGIELAEMHEKMRKLEEKANAATKDNEILRLRFAEVSGELIQYRTERDLYQQRLGQNEILQNELEFKRQRINSISARIGKTLNGDVGELVNLNVILEIKNKEAEDYFKKAQDLEGKLKQAKAELREKSASLEELKEKYRVVENQNVALNSTCRELKNENMTYSLIIKEKK